MYGYVSGLPAFLAYFGSGVVLLFLFSVIYSMVTPQEEYALIKSGNSAAATAHLGALIGFSLPLASAAANSVSFVDFMIWSVIGAIIQLIIFGFAAFFQKNLANRITQGELSAGLWAGGIALIVGLINAACMTY